MAEKVKGVGLFGLIGLVVSSCIGSGVFALTGQLANVAAPGSALVAWLICGAGFLFLALSLANLGAKRPDIDGIYQYATAGFGPFSGFLSGWGYWLSAWLGNVGFATMVAQVFGSLMPGVFATETGDPNIAAIVCVSVFLWLLTFLVINGVESAAFLNAIVMVVKIASILLFILFAIFTFKAGIFTEDFWGTMGRNATVMMVSDGEVELGDVSTQVTNCILIMMWVFIGIEGATVMSKRAEKKSDVGKATIIGLIVLLVLYIGASVLPYGVMPYEELVAAPKPATITVFEAMAPGWGGTFISVAIIISVLGSWLSFTMLPAETSSGMSEDHLLPASWNKMNSKNAPRMALIIVAACTQVFLIIAFTAEDAYTFAISMCTVTIAITWAFAAAYQVKYALQNHETSQLIFGIIALLFQVVGVLFTGWGFLLLACLGYIPGFFFYSQGRKEGGITAISGSEKIAMVIISLLGVISIPLTAVGIIPVF
ncbi:amino acid transporter [Cryptobacterium curtum DSM 15641]|uniref:Amino acid transporter n=1 Tax=Cryptobacterium curtum (strain ATCC 700683 / DSM 15641 / CCUG 43107 / 12-3) TaxID=469378 RepID=C7MLT8_CRYCD|nr:basic amino acid/polyamine antiporter [Cryptobacterium curtum]ACU93894.1 amino acid transporter [Cryptobacterium curtum DSM 15641]